MIRARALAVALVVLAAPAHAVAQSASVQAQSLFDDGRKLIKAGKVAEACTAFEGSHKLDPAVTTLLNLAECREKNRQLATAWGTFVDAYRMARASKNARLARVANKHARKLEPRLSRLTIAVAADRRIAGLEILRNDEPVDAAGWNHALPIDGGTYTLTARAPGHAAWSITRTLRNESDVQTIEVPKLAEARATPVASAPARAPVKVAPARPPSRGSSTAESATGVSAAPPRVARRGAAPPRVARRGVASAPGPGAVPPPASPTVDEPRKRSLVLPIAFGAGALAFGGGAIAFHLSGNSTYDRAKASTDPDERDSLYQSANNRRYLAQGLGVAALAAAGAAVYFTIRSGGESRASATAMPVVSPEHAGVALVGRW